MKLKLKFLHKVGRYHNPTTGQTVNIHKGKKVSGVGSMHFYTRSGFRVWVAECEIYGDNAVWQRVEL